MIEFTHTVFRGSPDDYTLRYHQGIVEGGGELVSITPSGDYEVKLVVRFKDDLKAAIYIATAYPADPERAAMFKMFWSGE